MSVTDPSSIVLLAGTLCIFVFVLHGLWFSNHPKNRKLQKNNKHDQELAQSNQIGKARIVTPDVPKDLDDDDFTLGTIKKVGEPAPKKASLNLETIDENGQSLSAELGIKEVSSEDAAKIQQRRLHQQQETTPWKDIYQIILVADPHRPYRGEDIENLCEQYGFLPGYLQDNMKIFFVYEDTKTRMPEVFRICSMEEPFYFPEQMEGFTTSALALYMSLPEPGKGVAYFRSLQLAAEILCTALGGTMQDPERHTLDNQQLAAIEQSLQAYDLTANTPAADPAQSY